MSALGHKRTFAAQKSSATWNVRFVPKTDIRSVLTYRSDFSDKVFYKRIPYWPVFSCIILPRCKTVFAQGSGQQITELVG